MEKLNQAKIDLTVAAQVGQELLIAKQRLEQSLQSLENVTCSCKLRNSQSYHSSIQQEADILSTPTRLPSRSTPLTSPRSPRFDLNKYIESLETENEDIRRQLKNLSKRISSQDRSLTQLEKERDRLAQEWSLSQQLMNSLQNELSIVNFELKTKTGINLKEENDNYFEKFQELMGDQDKLLKSKDTYQAVIRDLYLLCLRTNDSVKSKGLSGIYRIAMDLYLERCIQVTPSPQKIWIQSRLISKQESLAARIC